MKYWKKGAALLLGAALISSLAGCGEKQTAIKEKEDTKLLIAAAASLEYAMTEQLIPMFEKENPAIKIEGTYDSSGKLQTQIEEGLEADLFFSAATKQMDALSKEGYVEETTRKDLLENELVLIIPTDSNLEIKEFQDIEKGATIAIGDPKSVPVGQYAKEALTTFKIWDKIQDKVSLGSNVTEVLNWVSEGSAEVGIVYATDAKTTDKVKVIAKAPEGSLSKKVLYPAAILKRSEHTEETQKFLDFLCSEEAAKVFENYGFTFAIK